MASPRVVHSKVVSITRAASIFDPASGSEQWNIALDCGHMEKMTTVVKPSRATMFCRQCRPFQKYKRKSREL